MSRIARSHVVVGGGLGGLSCAAWLARAGHPVTVLEKAPRLGGRAATQVDAGFSFNLGPHALYRSGAAARGLADLGVAVPGGSLAAGDACAVSDGRLHTLPAGPVSLLTTGLTGLAGKLELARLLAGLARLDTARFDRVCLADWLRANFADSRARAFAQALFRLTAYDNHPEQQSAGAALRQLQGAVAQRVLYVDGGWQTLVDGLRQVAERHGATIRSETRAVAVVEGDAGPVVELADGSCIEAASVILATPPNVAASLLAQAASDVRPVWAEALEPVRAICLDLGLQRLPRPRLKFALGIDRPLYFSVHSAAARLTATPGHALVQAALYVPGNEDPDVDTVVAELEGLVDRVQPGWRDLVLARRVLPKMVVSYARVSAAMGGESGRPAIDASGRAGVYLVGDWVGAEGMLSDAAVASARAVATRIVAPAGRLAAEAA